jgi:hypothetical protein
MSRWWVPWLQIGYQHTFIHQVADFLGGLDAGETRSRSWVAAPD